MKTKASFNQETITNENTTTTKNKRRRAIL
jgi:hypothetical protein